MNHFTQLISRSDSTNKLNAKIDAMVQFFQKAENADKLWFLALFTGKRGRRLISSGLMREWVLQRTGLPEWLFVESYSAVGDLGETIALVLPRQSRQLNFSLSEWMQQINALKDTDEDTKKDFVLKAWDGLDYTERFIFNKLIGGSFRMGISAKMLVNAVAKYSGIDASTIAHSIMGNWSVDTTDFEALIRGTHTNTDASRPYPFAWHIL
jgi:DNA ligase-1